MLSLVVPKEAAILLSKSFIDISSALTFSLESLVSKA